MRLFVSIVLLTVVSLSSARPRPQQGQVDPAYLRQYYQNIASQQGQGAQRAATPIYEQQEQAPQRFAPSPAPQQFRQTQAIYQQPRQYQQPAPQPIQYSQPAAAPAPQPQPQPIPYRPQPQPKAAPKRPIYNAQPEEENPEDYDPNPSYQFGFDVKDDEFTNYQNRKETRDGNVIKGSYSVVDSDGFIRTVSYTADPKEGFKAEVVREPTDIRIKFPTPKPQAEEQQYRAAVKAQPQYVQPSQQGGYRQQAAPQQQYYQQ
jgi:hypothetical protein